MKSSNLYFILLLIVIILFACAGTTMHHQRNKKTLEGFEQAINIQNTFDKSCIESCEKEAKENGVKHFKETSSWKLCGDSKH